MTSSLVTDEHGLFSSNNMTDSNDNADMQKCMAKARKAKKPPHVRVKKCLDKKEYLDTVLCIIIV